jgi:cytochrome c oxidase subunit IV
MSTTADHIDHTGPDAHGDAHGTEHGGGEDHTGGHSDVFYVKIAAFLAVLTGMEVSLTYMDIGALFLPLLLILMTIKFFMVVLFFMHLKFDSKWFSFFFYAGLFLAVGCYSAFLATFRFFAGT